MTFKKPKLAPKLPGWVVDTIRYLVDLREWSRLSFDRILPLLAPSETKFLVALAIIIGLFTGVFAALFDKAIHWVFETSLGGSPSMLADQPLIDRWRILVFPAIGGLIVGPLIKHISPESKGHGVPEVMLAMHQKGGRIRGRVAALKALCSALTIGTGGSAGREGPIVQIGASIGSRLGQLFKLPAVTLKTMSAAGAAAGISAAFNAPLGGMAFALEIIMGEITAGPFAMVLFSTVVAATVSRSMHGTAAFFNVPNYQLVHSAELILYVILGVLAGVLSKVFVKMIYSFEDAFDDNLTVFGWPVDSAWRPAFGGLLVGSVGFFVPGALGTGTLVISNALAGQYGLGMLMLLFFTRFLSTSLTLGSGGSGGVFMPSIFCGAMLGSNFGQVAHLIFPETINPGAYAMVGMAAFVAGATHAPLTAILILFEMTNDYAIILPLMVAVVSAVLAAKTVEPESIYTMKLTRRGITLRPDPETSLLTQTPVGEIMTRRVQTIRSDFPIGKLGRHFNKTGKTGFPVINDEGKFVGMITYAEAQAAYSQEPPPSADMPIEKIMRSIGHPLFADDAVSEAVRRMHQDGIDRVPVVDREDPTKVLGIISEADLLDLYAKRIEA
ncbi:MAG: chloride channel protein [Elusimicrobia bacterium]|nr:MAG: chloride channel protein [Elusimicrobiota bacterium]